MEGPTAREHYYNITTGDFPRKKKHFNVDLQDTALISIRELCKKPSKDNSRKIKPGKFKILSIVPDFT